MLLLKRTAATIALAAAIGLAPHGLPRDGARAQEAAAFSHHIVTRDADRLDLILKTLADSEAGRRALTEQPAAAHLAQGLKALGDGRDAREAVRALSLAAAASPKNAAVWTALARAFLAATPAPGKGSERLDLPANAAGAAWRAYTLAAAREPKAEALAVLAEALKRRSMWRPAIDALKASLALDSVPTVAESLAALQAEHGFRVVDYKVDADATSPRLCVNLSERLAPAQPAELAKFARLDGREPESLAAAGKQLCVDGLKHGQRYQLEVRAGLAAENGETLAKSSEIAVYVRDRKPSVRLGGRAYVLPSRGQQGIPVTSVNTRELKVEIYRVGDRALGLAAGSDSFLKSPDRWDLRQIRDKSGQRVWTGTLEVADRLNEDINTAIPVSDVLKAPEPGVYLVVASLEEKADRSGDGAMAAQWFVISDLGLTALSGEDGLHAFARSLASTRPAAAVKLRLLAANNEVLGEAATDANGYARFDRGLMKGEAGLSPRLLVAEAGRDYALLDLATAAFDLADRGVKGRHAPGALDAYLYAERGVYRPGETVHLAGLVRTAQGAASGVPATLIVTRPDGVEHRRLVLADQGVGGRAHDLALARTAMTGTWRAKLHADPKAPALAETAFLVEDFVPERLALTLTPEGKVMRAGEAHRIAIAGRYLYGPAASGLGLEGEIIVKAARGDIAGFPGYRFGIDGEKFPAVRETLDGLGTTAADGTAAIMASLPRMPRTSRPLEADLVVRLREPAGRAIERRVTLPVDPAEAHIGVKPLFADNRIGEGEEAIFEAIALGPDGRTAETASLKWEIVRLDRRWQWYSHEGEWRYEPVTTTRRLANGTAEIAGGRPARIAFKPEWGRHRLDVTMAGGQRTSVLFQAGWGASDNADSPEMLEVALDKPAYQPGETARLRIASREAGRALVAVLSNGLLVTREVDVPKGGAEVALQVEEAWLPGAYVTATLYRALDERARRMPARAVGVAWLGLDPRSRTLDVTLETPEKALPGRPLSVPVRLGGLKPGEEARLTVAAVDVGILNLTRHEAPAPERWFNAQRRLGVEMRDLYGRLIDGMRAERGRLRTGGDGGGMRAEGSPPVESPLALFSGLVKVGPDGTARVAFALPDFNGQIRVMAVAWSATKTGSAARDVIVRDRLALTVSGPRFLTLGDEARLELDVHNIEGPAAGYKVSVEREAAGVRQSLASREVALKAGERRREAVVLKPAELGTGTYDIGVKGPDGLAVSRRLTLDVKAPTDGIRRATVSSLAPNGRLTLSKDLFQDLIPARSRLTLTVGPTAAFDVAGLLTQLDRYPYGCAEQTTSRALPLLYVNDMAKRLGLAQEAEIKARIAAAIDRLMEMQDASGAFGVWSPADGDIWLTSYVADFLTRAKEAGFAVRREAHAQALDRLANHLAYAQDFERGGEERAYALYVLARNGRAPVGDLRYYVDARLDRFASPLAKAQLGAALALLGDQARAGRAFEAALAGLEGDAAKSLDGARGDYGSLVRDGAGMLTLAAETGAVKARQAGLARVLAAAFRARQYTSTQEQAWMLLAARALAEEAKATRLTIGGAPHAGELTRLIRPANLAAGPLDVVNAGANPLDAVISVEGAALTPEPAIARGFKIERTWYTLDGRKVDLAGGSDITATLAQNTRLVAVVTITGDDPGGRVLVVDRLPAGLEVENPRLVAGGDTKAFPWLTPGREAQHTEFRDDRVVAAFSFFGEGGRRVGGNGDASQAAQPVSGTVAYVVRAVTPGTYVHPAATVEDMYRPERFARTAGGRLTITAQP